MLARAELRSCSLSARACYVSAVASDLGELSVIKSHNYPATKGGSNPLEPPVYGPDIAV